MKFSWGQRCSEMHKTRKGNLQGEENNDLTPLIPEIMPTRDQNPFRNNPPIVLSTLEWLVSLKKVHSRVLCDLVSARNQDWPISDSASTPWIAQESISLQLHWPPQGDCCSAGCREKQAEIRSVRWEIRQCNIQDENWEWIPEAYMD